MSYFNIITLLLTMISSNVTGCPEWCVCSRLPNDNCRVTCSSGNLIEFPNKLPNNTEQVVIANNPVLRWPNSTINDPSWSSVTSFIFKNNYPLNNLTIENISWLSSVEVLCFRKSGLQMLQYNLFGVLRKLKSLDLSMNSNLEYDAIFNSIAKSNTRLQLLNISYCNKIPNQQKIFRQRHFINLRHSPIRVLDMTSVNLFNIEAGISYFLPELEVLNVSHNHMIIDFRILCQISLFKKLYVFDISYWKMPDPFFRVERSLLRRDELMPFMDKINNSTQTCNKDFGSSLTCFPLAESLRYFYFHHIKWSSAESPSISKCISNNNMSKVWMSNNNYRLFNGSIRGAQHVVFFDMSENILEYMSQEFLFHEPLLKVLNLSSNRLWKMENCSSFTTLFATNQFLQHIDLSNNVFHNLPLNIFNSNFQLISINLSRNKLYDLHLNLTSRHVRFIDISRNNIINIHDEFRKHLDQLAKSIRYQSIDDNFNSSEDVPHFDPLKLTLDLSNNYFVCTCAYIDFIIWMKTTNITLLNFENYECSLEGNWVRIAELDIDTIQQTCDFVLSADIMAVIVIFSLLVAFVIVSLFIYRKTKTFSMQRKIRKYKSSEPPKYVAFVCYSHHDSEFVLRDLRPDLERRLATDMLRSDGLLCINDRDFLIGEQIEEAIVRSVLSSSMVILIISEKFMESQWCKFETNVAWMEKKPILIILKEQLVLKKLPSLLRNIYNKNVRLMWNGENRKSEFLETLYKSMLNKL